MDDPEEERRRIEEEEHEYERRRAVEHETWQQRLDAIERGLIDPTDRDADAAAALATSGS